ncbi:FMN-binding protein MioC [Ferrimonas sediminicola]|uniref:FMN-binding protein MioC n=1 Tax=Ferrimonas sediminicola TaxID=2569538 RepID=A0A4V5NUM6_9GAMM|nr:FMN-binding protein MioC [Ferrimonas sediminicola]TKB46995.1 FMN-binding protein MioC [Ferrimonas sediminicola]
MTQLALIVGTTMGGAEAVADELAEKLQIHGIDTEIHLNPSLESLMGVQNWLIVTSTHGAGEIPDNLHPLAEALQTADLSGIHYAICGIGDSSYDTFCGAAKSLEDRMQQGGAKELVHKIEIDVQGLDLPEDKALLWIDTLIPILSN